MSQVEPYTPQVVLAVGAHANDIDLCAAGSVGSWIKQEAIVHYAIITDGCKGSADHNMTCDELIELRKTEQQSAATVLGVEQVHFLGYEDGTLEVNMKLKKDLVRLIRQIRPDTVVVMDPTMIYISELNFINHPDHRAAGQATLDAVFPLARDHLSFAELAEESRLEPHKVDHVLLINFERQNYYVDITATYALKLSALKEHKSQITNFQQRITMLEQYAARLGAKTGSRYAEGFMRIDTEE